MTTFTHQLLARKTSTSSSRLTQVPQIRPLADIVHYKYIFTYLLTYLIQSLQTMKQICSVLAPPSSLVRDKCDIYFKYWPFRGLQ